MSIDFSEHYKRNLVQWVENHDLEPEVFVTFSTKKTNEAEFLRNVNLMLMKSSKYSKSHIGAVGGYEISSDHMHGHLVILGENKLKNGFLRERWTHGTVHECFFRSRANSSPNSASFYAINHPEIIQFRDYCPDPHRCHSQVCIHGRKNKIEALDTHRT